MFFVRLGSLRGIGVLLTATLALAACGGGGGSHAPLPPAQSSPNPGDAVPSAAATFTFTFPKNSTARARKPQYLSSATASITLTVSDDKSHGTSTDIFANVPASLKATQHANFANTTGNPNTPGQCGTDPSNPGNIKCTATFQLPVGDITATISSWDASNGTGNLLSQFITTTPLWVQQGVANTFAISLDAQAGSTGCPSPSIAVSLPGSGAGGTQCGTIFFSGTTGLVFPVTVKDAAGKTIPATGPGAPVIGASTTGGIVGVAPSSNPSQITITPNGTVGGGTVTVTASGLNAGDGITQRTTTFNIQEDAQVGNAGCASPSIVVTKPGSGVTGSECSGGSAGTFVLNGTSALVFTVTLKDGSNNTIAAGGAGAPTLAVSSTGGLLTSAVAAQNPYTVTLTPNGTAGSGTVTVTASGANPGDGVITRSITFNISLVSTLIGLGQSNTTQGQVTIYTLGASSFTQYGNLSPSALGVYTPAEVGFDSNNTLYMFDNNHNAILEFSSGLNASSGQSPSATITSGITGDPTIPLLSSFALADDGTMAVGNSGSATTINQLVTYNSGATTPSLTRAFGGPQAGYTYRAGATTLLTNSGGTVFGAAVGLEADNGTTNSNISATAFGTGKIGIITTSPTAITGSSASTCSVTCYEFDITNEGGGAIGQLTLFPGLIWNNHNQELVFLDDDSGKVSYYPFNTGTSTFGAPVLLATYPAPASTSTNAAMYAVSRDGHFAFSYADITGNTIINVYDASHTIVPAWNNKQFPLGANGFVVDGLAFLPNDDLLIAGGYNTTPNQLFAYTLTDSTNPVATATSTLSGGGTTGVTSSAVRRRPLGGRRGLLRRP